MGFRITSVRLGAISSHETTNSDAIHSDSQDNFHEQALEFFLDHLFTF